MKKTNEKDGVYSEAIFSECEKYRYFLSRTWDSSKPRIMFIGLNPSTADEMKNDPTVARMINFAKKWNYGSIIVSNLFAFRSTFPADLKKISDPIGKETDLWIKKSAEQSEKIIASWGNHGLFLNRSRNVLNLIDKEIFHFGLTKIGEPKHPLYLKSNLEAKKFKKPF